LMNRMLACGVANLMGNHAGQHILIVPRRVDQSGVDVDVARDREGIDVARIDHAEGPGEIGSLRHACQAAAQMAHQVVELRIAADAVPLLYLHISLSPRLNLLALADSEELRLGDRGAHDCGRDEGEPGSCSMYHGSNLTFESNSP